MNIEDIKKIDKKYKIAGAIAIILIIIIAGYVFKQKSTPSSTNLTKLTGEISSISDNKSSITIKTDSVSYTADMSKIKTIKNKEGVKISINEIKTGDRIELRTRTNTKGGKNTTIEAYSLKDLSISTPKTEPAPENNNKK
ncbi:MAG: hypothetical protein US25_C0010G0007 [Candidatus Moranbacteria bacterium GW2011_GWE1_36_7]|nr:MAG: hypothetical protein UR99_C0004G0013 [Candidatus Moranbacteria bacterium GW2011_GWD2_36_12]KKQ06923.1 MAG: hypothetical protein US16_C0006G0013 [Candidatus Moranbacteria bacterium GW2011_GWE2_36_40]KKQ15161.1 MAG: hypothetical protein US25_C0010G0007 [Candidatus Moranbacteria bacterium GW2011_GWE1_36_7]